MGRARGKQHSSYFPARHAERRDRRWAAIAQNQHSELVIHGRNGQIRDKDSHGHDPCPPKAKDCLDTTKLTAAPAATPIRRILSSDGAGIKGTYPAAFLAALEQDLGQPIGGFFELR